MDVAYNQHSRQAKRKNRSSTSLSLAPLTTKLPLTDQDHLPEPFTTQPPHTTSYLQGKSAPSTPGLLSRSPARSRSDERRSSAAHLPKSRSTTHLPPRRRGGAGGATTPGSPATTRHAPPHRSSRRHHDDAAALQAASRDRSDSDWLLRAGALLSTEARESKGQAWLATRESSTSLAGLRDADADDEAYERELARERELASRQASRRGSLAPAGAGEEVGGLAWTSPSGSRLASRSHSRVGSRGGGMLTPRGGGEEAGYFPDMLPEEGYYEEEEDQGGPLFVGLDAKLESIERDTSAEDEDHVRMLVKRERTAGLGMWFGSVLGWPLFAVDEEVSEEGEATESEVEEETTRTIRRRSSMRQLEGDEEHEEESIPAPKADEGGWQDAAWLLSVATKVIL